MKGHALRAGAPPSRVAVEARPVVVKLGGSVVRSPELPSWLDVIAASPQPIIVVPGGGALADEVRACQSHLGFGDASAHRMALLAMDQLAWAVAGLRQGLEVGATEADLRAALDRGSVAVWAPYALIAERTDIEESWRLTSDSLALWLASRVGASRCYLIKSILRQRKRLGAEQLAREGIVDEAFPSVLKESRVPSFLLGRGDQDAFASALARPGCAESCGAEID
ncbi:MAG TPA: uridylate kinase [Methyloceanibacter sp.]|jgi:5-(aminomethyl)-3-furanmethanol phosphate kinase